MADRESNVYEAKLAEQAERYDEMIQAMKRVVALNTELTLEERNLLSVAYKNVIGARRAAWRIVSSIEEQEEDAGAGAQRLRLVADYRGEIEGEVRKICSDILELLDKHLIPSATEEESKLVYYKLKGDYNRYLAEIEKEDVKKKLASESCDAYTAATTMAASLSPAHPLRLGLALNFSVFQYEIMEQPSQAISLAREAVRQAHLEMDTLTSETFKESTLILQLLGDNVALWSSGLECEDD